MRPEHQTAIYKKAKEIEKLVEMIIELIEDSELPLAEDFDKELIRDKLLEMEENAFEIPILISEASVPNLPYDFKMENAVFVKSAALDLMGDVLYIEEMGLKDIDYLDLLHDEIEALRLLFIEWIKTFDLWKYDSDDWGLFSPEGIKIIEFEVDDSDDDYEDDAFDDEEDD